MYDIAILYWRQLSLFKVCGPRRCGKHFLDLSTKHLKMTTLTMKSRAVGAVVGSLIADAAALPTHWIYDVKKLDSVLEGKPFPEFLEKSQCPFYAIPTGSLSCYGDQAYVLLESLVESKGYNKEDYKKRLMVAFGPDSPYDSEKKLGHQPTRADFPIPCSWNNGSLRQFIKNVQEGKEVTGADDSQADGVAKVAPLVALYAGQPEMASTVEEVVRVTQENDLAVNCAVSAARILEKFILSGPVPGVLEEVMASSPKETAEFLKTALDSTAKDHRSAVQEMGSSCALPGNFQGDIHCLAASDGDFVQTLRKTLVAGGDNCARSCMVGACMGAQVGLPGLPQEWVVKTSRGTHIVELAEKLLALKNE